MDVNLDGVFRCCRAVLPQMMHRRRGSIVNVSSLSAVSGVAGQTAYAASKAALLGLTRALAREVGKRGVRVNAVLPGFVPTDMTASLPEQTWCRTAAVCTSVCRAARRPIDVANLVAFLILRARRRDHWPGARSVDAGAPRPDQWLRSRRSSIASASRRLSGLGRIGCWRRFQPSPACSGYRFAYWAFTRLPSWTEWLIVPTFATFCFLVARLKNIRAR